MNFNDILSILFLDNFQSFHWLMCPGLVNTDANSIMD